MPATPLCVTINLVRIDGKLRNIAQFLHRIGTLKAFKNKSIDNIDLSTVVRKLGIK